jgi:hypothetical protein
VYFFFFLFFSFAHYRIRVRFALSLLFASSAERFLYLLPPLFFSFASGSYLDCAVVSPNRFSVAATLARAPIAKPALLGLGVHQMNIYLFIST